MASGRSARGLYGGAQGTIASMSAGIAEMILRAGQSDAQGDVALGAGIGGGIAQAGQNIRTEKARKADRQERERSRAERAQERADAKAERDAARAESRADRAEARTFRDRVQAWQEAETKRKADEGHALRLAKEAAEAQERALRLGAIGSMMGDQVPDNVRAEAEGAQAYAQQAAQAASAVGQRVAAGAQSAGPIVLQQTPGGLVDQGDPEVMHGILAKKYEDLRQTLDDAIREKDQRSVIAASAALKQTERRMIGLGEMIQQRKAERREAEKREQAAAKYAEEQADLQRKGDIAQATILNESQRWGLDPEEMRRTLAADIEYGSSPETIRAALKAEADRRAKAAKPEPTPEERGRERGAANFEADEEQRRRMLALPVAERDKRARQKYEAWRLRNPQGPYDDPAEYEARADAALDAFLNEYGL